MLGKRTAGEGKLPAKLKKSVGKLAQILEAGERNRQELPETNRGAYDAAKEIQHKFNLKPDDAKNIVDHRSYPDVGHLKTHASENGNGNTSMVLVGVLVAAAILCDPVIKQNKQ